METRCEEGYQEGILRTSVGSPFRIPRRYTSLPERYGHEVPWTRSVPLPGRYIRLQGTPFFRLSFCILYFVTRSVHVVDSPFHRLSYESFLRRRPCFILFLRDTSYLLLYLLILRISLFSLRYTWKVGLSYRRRSFEGI